MSRRKSREDLIGQLERLAFYRPNDAIRIAMEEGVDIRKLRLEGVAEFKCHANGAMELKFFDRTKALELLLALEGEHGDNGGLMGFLQQLSGGEST